MTIILQIPGIIVMISGLTVILISFDFDYSWNISNNISLFAGNSLSYKHDRLSEIINEKPIFLHKMLNEYLYLDLDGSLKHYKYFHFLWRRFNMENICRCQRSLLQTKSKHEFDT
jgi:hypothetical protein